VFNETLKSESKTIEFVQSRLRSATDVFKYGGHVTKVYRDQQFRMHFDNKRVLAPDHKGDIALIDSTPLLSVKHGENLRYISKLPKLKQYSKFASGSKIETKYKNVEDLAIKAFIKGLLLPHPMFNLHRQNLTNYQSIVDFVLKYNPDSRLTPNHIAVLKNRSIKIKSVPRLKQTESFVRYLKDAFCDFDEDSFFRF
jgi:hypothetical protein